MSEYLKERQKPLVDMLNQPDAVLSIMQTTVRSESQNSLYRLFGPQTPTTMDATIMDILTIKQMGDDDYNPSQFVCGGCDPAIPLLLATNDMGMLSSHATPYIKREWSTSYCGDEKMLTRAMISELPNLPWGRSLSIDQKKNLLLQAAMRQMEGEIMAAIMRMWTDDFQYGAMMISGPGIPKKNSVLDMNRNKKLFARLEGEGWCNPNVSRIDTLRAFGNHVYDQSGDDQSYPNTYVFDPIAKKKFFEGIEFHECSPCRAGINTDVTRPRTQLAIDIDRADTPRGVSTLRYSDDVLGNVTFICIDERRSECILDADGNDTGERRKVPVLSPGTVMAFNSNNHAPIGLQGRIQRNNVNVPMERYTYTYDESRTNPRADKIFIGSETAPLYFNRRENTIGTFYIAEDECPRPKNVCEPYVLACDPEGGKKAVAAAGEAQQRLAQAVAEATVRQTKGGK